MEVKRIKCPNCGVVLDVRNSKNETVKIFTCPQCKATLKVQFCQGKPLEAHTFIASRINTNGETQLGVPNKDSSETRLVSDSSAILKNALLKADAREYPLIIGMNIIGRKAASSSATVQIETSDRYMSRQHARIVVARMDDGRLKSVISNDRNRNMTTIDGQKLLQGDRIVLSDGDKIVMGKTTVIYKER